MTNSTAEGKRGGKKSALERASKNVIYIPHTSEGRWGAGTRRDMHNKMGGGASPSVGGDAPCWAEEERWPRFHKEQAKSEFQ